MSNIDKFFSSLNEEQRNIVFNSSKEPMLIIAGPGSGKTRVIVAKILHLIKTRKVLPSQILALTFTNKAADEMNERVCKFLQIERKLHIKTFHSFGSWLLKKYYRTYINLPQYYFSIWDQSDVKNILKNLELSPPEEAASLASLILKVKDSSFNSLSKEDPIYIDYINLEKIIIEYEREKEKCRAMDFSDLILKPIEMLSKNSAIKLDLTKQFKVILIDEYQDTNYSQFKLLKELYSSEQYLIAVGDEDQSIYSFRGARVDNILDFEGEFKNTQKFYLTQNYRSTQNIVSIAKGVISKNKSRFDKKLRTENERGCKIKVFVFQTAEEEADYISNLLSEDERETGILYRLNSQSLLHERALVQKHIPHILLGSIRFYEREEIKDILAYLKVILNPQDKVSFLRVINKPSRGIGAKAKEKILSYEGSVNFNLILAMEEALKASSGKLKTNGREFIYNYKNLKSKLEKGYFNSLAAFIDSLSETFGVWDYYLAKRDLHERRDSNISELINSAKSYQASLEGLSLFLENSTLSPFVEGAKEAFITLSTVHASKGLEFERVVISGLDREIFPMSRGGEVENLEEERRLLYVAMTRAKKELLITTIKDRFFKGRYFKAGPSQFFNDIDKSFCQVIGYNSPWDLINFQFEIGDKISYNGTYGQIVDKWISGYTETYLKIKLENGKSALLIAEYTSGLKKI